MAIQSWQNVSILVGTYEVACRARGFAAPEVDVAQLDTTPLCTTGWKSSIAGHRDVKWSADVMLDYAATELDETLGLANLAVGDVPISICPDGTGQTEGALAYAWPSVQVAYHQSAPVGELATGMISGTGRGVPVVRGTLMRSTSAAVSATGTGTVRQLGAVSATQRVYAALHVLSSSGSSPTMALKLQSAPTSGFASPTDRVTLSTVTANTNRSQWSSAAGAITDQYWRLSWTLGGTTPSFTFAVVCGIATP